MHRGQTRKATLQSRVVQPFHQDLLSGDRPRELSDELDGMRPRHTGIPGQNEIPEGHRL